MKFTVDSGIPFLFYKNLKASSSVAPFSNKLTNYSETLMSAPISSIDFKYIS